MLQKTWTMLFSKLRISQLLGLTVFLAVTFYSTEARVALYSPGAGQVVGAGARGQVGGGNHPMGGGKVTGRPSKQASTSGRASEYLVPRNTKPQLTVFERASRGLPLDDDELAMLSPEQRSYWESQRASAMLGVS